jgi:hypothetical protein
LSEQAVSGQRLPRRESAKADFKCSNDAFGYPCDRALDAHKHHRAERTDATNATKPYGFNMIARARNIASMQPGELGYSGNYRAESCAGIGGFGWQSVVVAVLVAGWAGLGGCCRR